MERWLYELLLYAFNKGVVAGVEMMQEDHDTYGAFQEVLEHAYDELELDEVDIKE